ADGGCGRSPKLPAATAPNNCGLSNLASAPDTFRVEGRIGQRLQHCLQRSTRQRHLLRHISRLWPPCLAAFSVASRLSNASDILLRASSQPPTSVVGRLLRALVQSFDVDQKVLVPQRANSWRERTNPRSVKRLFCDGYHIVKAEHPIGTRCIEARGKETMSTNYAMGRFYTAAVPTETPDKSDAALIQSIASGDKGA